MEKLLKCKATDKTIFNTSGEAKQALLNLKTSTRYFDKVVGKRVNRRIRRVQQVRYYICPFCKGFHLTSQDPRDTNEYLIEKKKQKQKDRKSGLILNKKQAEDWKADGLPFPDIKTNNNDGMV
jgi:hypothetical protein